MPKLETKTSFRVPIEVSEVDLGRLMAIVSQALPNAVFHRPELITGVVNFRGNKTHETSGVEFLSEWIKDHVSFKAIEAVKAFREDGRGNGGSCYPAIAILVEKGDLKKIAPGEYARADQKALPAPEKKHASAGVAKRGFSKPATETILAYMRRNHGRGNNAKLYEIFVKEGRAKASVSPAIDKLLKDKKIKRTIGGTYEMLSEQPKAEKPKAPKPNGETSHIEALTEAVTNG